MNREDNLKRSRAIFSWSILIMTLVFVFYVPALKGGFIWDDDDYVTKNENLETWAGLKRIWLEVGATYQYYPMVHSSYWVEYRLWKDNPFGYHLVNVLLHGLNAALVYLILRKLGLSWSWLASLAFALHPVHVESVAWITERKNALSGFFYLTSFICYLRFTGLVMGGASVSSKQGGKTRETQRFGAWRYYFISFGLYACALFSKTVTSSLPVIALLIFWWKGKKIGWRAVAPLIPFFILGGVLGAITARLEKHQIGAIGAPWEWTFIERCLIAGRSLWFYAGKLLIPHPLIFIYPRWRIDAGYPPQYLYLLGALIVLVALYALREKIGRGPLVAVLFFSITLFPALGFFNVYPMLYSYVADHFQYLASIGMIALYTEIIVRGLKRIFGEKNVSLYVFACLLAMTLGGLTWRQARMYKDLETLWRTTIERNPGAWLARNNLGTVLLDQGKVDEAIEHFVETTRINPGYEIAYYNLGYSHLKKGDYDKSVEYYRKAIELNPKYTNAYINLGMAYDDLGEHEKAIENYRKAQRLKPENDTVYNCLGYAFSSIGALDEAIRHYRKCIELNPRHLEASYKLARALYEKGDMDGAIQYYKQALVIDPDSPFYYLEIADALLKKGSDDAAKDTLYQGAALFPKDFWIKNMLAWTLATNKNDDIRNAQEAVRAAEEARHLSENREPTILDTLAAAYAEAGRFEEASRTAKEALKLARELKQEDLAKDIEARIALFKTEKPFRE